jgi:flagellar motor switch protein FliN
MAGLENLDVDVAVVLGKTCMPLSHFLKLGRGAVIDLESGDTDLVEILANGHLIARGEVAVNGTNVRIEITEIVPKATIVRERGTTIGDACHLDHDLLDQPESLAA